MPIIKCKKPDGKNGYKIEGQSGCPHNTYKQALKQLKAIKVNQTNKK